MNNFDENNEFVRRKIDPNTTPQNISGRNLGQVRRPQNTAPRAPQNGQAKPRPGTQGEQLRRSVNSGVRSAGTPANPRPASPRTNHPPKPERPKKEIDKGSILRNILIFIAMLAGLLILGSALLLSTLYVAPEKTKTTYSYYYGSDDKSTSESVTVNKVLYMNLTEISDMCAFTVSGTKASLRYTADQGEYVEFTIGSVSAKINGDIVNMEGAALVRENENVWIPLSFGEAYFGGILFERDEEESTIKILREELPESSDEAPIYADVTFRIKGSQTIEGIDEDPDIGDIADMGFVNDLSEYEQYMNPSDRDAYLILVNKTNSISAEDIPENLVSIVNVRQDGRKEQMVECAEKALEALFIEMKSAGYTDVSVTSGYRSYNKQVSLFTTYLQREMANNPSLSEAEAKEIVLTYSAFPGTSEHQTGLCCDMHNLPSADVAFAQKEAYTWLKENCYKFGFIIRFPEDKVDITGYSFEPWHYRFVGRYHATRIHNLGMCLEEYIEHLSRAENQ
ncbi:MAG: D-alanyl-D-alanine carboxypeptidase family protein [Clostridia bacterium]|nr:D-alanyl-D-alanine carboxypeptidase family protein [Clostridia bacterium]